jgi:hypothetical protein
MPLFQRDYDLGFEYAIKLARVERSTPSEIGATAARFAATACAHPVTPFAAGPECATRAYAAGMVDAAIAMAQHN